jgi:hypothetical protein
MLVLETDMGCDLICSDLMGRFMKRREQYNQTGSEMVGESEDPLKKPLASIVRFSKHPGCREMGMFFSI